MPSASSLLAGNDDDDDERDDAEEQTQDAPAERVASLHAGNQRAHDRGDDASDGNEYPLDTPQNEARGEGLPGRRESANATLRTFFQGDQPCGASEILLSCLPTV